MGESSRSLYERGKEHWRNFKAGMEDNHIKKHHVIHHGGEGTPRFHLKPVMFHQTALSRQISEAVRIERWGEDLVLNSKTEFNRCRISRLTIGEEVRRDGRAKIAREEEQGEDDQTVRWERGRAKDRRIQELTSTIDLERGIARTPPRKRGERRRVK